MRIVNYILFLGGLIAGFTTNAAWARHTIDDSSRGADGVRVGDINRDGLPDLVTGWEEGGVVRVYLNPGPDRSAGAWPAITVGNVDSPEDAVFVDVDGDGQLDVVSSCEGKNRTVYVHWAPAKSADLLDSSRWTTGAFPATANVESWMFCLPMNVDVKRGIDLVIGSKGRNASVSWLESPLNPRDLSAWTLHRMYDATWIMSLIRWDVDGDGDPDVLFSDRKPPGSGVKWLLNPNRRGDKLKPWRVESVGAAESEIMFIDLFQAANPEPLRVGAAVKPHTLVGWDHADENGWRELGRHGVSGKFGTAKAVRLADIDLDGRLDFVFTCEQATGGKSGVGWIKNNSGGVLIENDISGPDGVKFDRIELLDLDADGDLDIVTCEERKNLGVIWYENPTR